MKDARTVFETIMKAKGFDDFSKTEKGIYVYVGLQNKWNYFLMGWEMRGLQ